MLSRDMLEFTLMSSYIIEEVKHHEEEESTN